MKNAEEVFTVLHTRFPAMAARKVDPAPSVTVPPAELREHMVFLRDQCAFDFLVFMTALDRQPENALELVYRVFSHETKASVVIRVSLPREAARLPTVSDIYRTAEWHERETAEMFGVEFTGHPDPRRLLLPDDLEGYPLRKDFTHPNMIRLPEVP
jgi:NADH-quinone oxidoreductase subunit C